MFIQFVVDHASSGAEPMTEFDLAGDAAGHIAPDLAPPASQNSGPRRSDQRDEARQDAGHRYQSGTNQTRTSGAWQTGPTRQLPSMATSARPTIPSAREETVELPTAEPVAPPLPTQADRGTTRRARREAAPAGAGRPERPDRDDAAAEVWDLVERAQEGDSEAFAQIYLRYNDAVHRYIYFRVGNRQIAEDLTSDTFMRALRRIGSVTWQGRDLGAWLITIARNLVADHFKAGRTRFELSTGDVLDADAEERGPEGSPEAAVVEHISNVTLLRAVQQLNPEQRSCIVLRFLQGFSVAETADAMGKNEGAIKALQYRAVRALHRLLPEGFQQ